MRKLLLVAAFALACSSLALAAPEAELCLGGPTTGCVAYSGGAQTIGDWSVQVTDVSFSPNAFDGLSDTVLSVTCNSVCDASNLYVLVSDVGFTSGVAGFDLGYSLTTLIGGGSTTEWGYAGPSNTDYDISGTPIGPITLSSVTANQAVGAGNASTTPYALTLVAEFDTKGTGPVEYGTAGSIIGLTPEPTSIVLFGTILSLGGFAFRRKLKKNS
jgi:hypothetical protein